MNPAVLNGGEVAGAPNWLPAQNQSVPPGVFVGAVVDLSLGYMAVNGVALDAVLRGIKNAILAAVEAAEGALSISAVSAAIEGAPGVSTVIGASFNSDTTITSVDAPVTTAAQYIRIVVRTIA